jgi:hypothetical protein
MNEAAEQLGEEVGKALVPVALMICLHGRWPATACVRARRRAPFFARFAPPRLRAARFKAPFC